MRPFAQELGYGGEPYEWDDDRRAILRAELDAWFARAYGLSREELIYVLDPSEAKGDDYPSESFRVLRNSERLRFKSYRTRDLTLEAFDSLAGGLVGLIAAA